ncbi:AraC family transcriptional regulator [Rheinheimera baltica]|uniref:AraC family transcriptional regulator n=1 Tax=Rheinheimera baltica TaxID=67576 RepID=UPI00273DDCF6|nr:AraC family transcriptional regulator [Rheinheimera baltica]MDP5148734.1 AraC family transcriptional regulator [Rheinheimera baltica]
MVHPQSGIISGKARHHHSNLARSGTRVGPKFVYGVIVLRAAMEKIMQQIRVIQVERYATRVEKVLAYIESLGAQTQPTLDELAAVAAISPFHFHRVWRVMTGETVFESLRRVQMGRALVALQNERAPVVEVAEAAGYASGQSFARSLKAFAGASASELRADPAKMAAFVARITHGLRAQDDDVPGIEVTIVELQPLKILATRNTGAYESLFNGYGRLFELVTQCMPPEDVRGIHGLWPDDPRTTAPEDFRFDCAFSVAQTAGAAPPGTHWAELPSGTCLSVRHVGDYDALLDTIDWLYAMALEAGIELRNAPLFAHYIDDPESTPVAEWRTDVYLPIEVNQI